MRSAGVPIAVVAERRGGRAILLHIAVAPEAGKAARRRAGALDRPRANEVEARALLRQIAAAVKAGQAGQLSDGAAEHWTRALESLTLVSLIVMADERERQRDRGLERPTA